MKTACRVSDLAKTILVTLFALSVAVAAGAEELSSREWLAAQEGTSLVYTVDETHTFVIGDEVRAPRDMVVITRYGKSAADPYAAYMVEHTAAQPMVWKNGAVKDGDLPARVDLDVELLQTARSSYTAIDLFQHFTSACEGAGGEREFVVPLVHGRFKRLTQVDAVNAFNYILMSGDDGGAWYMACETGDRDTRFIVKKNYSFINDGTEVAEVHYGRTLAGVNYARFGEEAVSEDARKRGRLEGLSTDEFLAEIAKNAASLRVDFVKPHAGSRYLVSYTKTGRTGCEYVTIEHLRKRVIEENRTDLVYEYKVCGDKVAKLDERRIDVPDDDGKTMFASHTDTFLARGE